MGCRAGKSFDGTEVAMGGLPLVFGLSLPFLLALPLDLALDLGVPFLLTLALDSALDFVDVLLAAVLAAISLSRAATILSTTTFFFFSGATKMWIFCPGCS